MNNGSEVSARPVFPCNDSNTSFSVGRSAMACITQRSVDGCLQSDHGAVNDISVK